MAAHKNSDKTNEVSCAQKFQGSSKHFRGKSCFIKDDKSNGYFT